MLALGLARLSQLAPGHRRVGLSATVADPAPLQRFLVPQPMDGEALAELVIAKGGAKPEIDISASDSYVPWAGHLARHAMVDVMAAIGEAKTALVFVNTRSQAERTFQELWRINDDNLAHRAASRLAGAGAAPQGGSGDDARAACAPWSAPRPSIWASTGARWTR